MIDRRAVAAMCLSAAGFVGILTYENFVPVAVAPVKGDVPTYGFGTTQGVKAGDKIAPTAAVVRALKDASQYEGAIKRCVKVPLHQNEYDAYTSLAYNIGPTAFCDSTLVKKLNNYEYRAACLEIRRWDKFRGQTLPGLTARRTGESNLCLGLV